MAENDDCIFCKVAGGTLPAYILYKDEHVLAFHDINPQAPVHVLVVPAKHIQDVDAAGRQEPEIIGRMVQAAARVAAELNVAQNGYRLVLNNGVGAGQIVQHLHLHLLSGRRFGWPPG